MKFRVSGESFLFFFLSVSRPSVFQTHCLHGCSAKGKRSWPLGWPPSPLLKPPWPPRGSCDPRGCWSLLRPHQFVDQGKEPGIGQQQYVLCLYSSSLSLAIYNRLIITLLLFLRDFWMLIFFPLLISSFFFSPRIQASHSHTQGHSRKCWKV